MEIAVAPGHWKFLQGDSPVTLASILPHLLAGSLWRAYPKILGENCYFGGTVFSERHLLFKLCLRSGQILVSSYKN